jgi:hypothetical protein
MAPHRCLKDSEEDAVKGYTHRINFITPSYAAYDQKVYSKPLDIRACFIK